MIPDVQEWYHRLTAGEGGPRLWVPVRAVVRWVVVFYRQLQRDQAFVRAAGMAYTTLVALVPLLLLAFGVLGAAGLLDTEREAIEGLLFGTFLGDIPEVREFLLPGLMQVDLGTLGAVGVVGLLVVASRLFIMVERAYNDIYGVRVERSFLARILNFYFTITAVPLLAVAALVATQDALSHVDGGVRLFAWIGPFALFGVFLTALKLFPCTRVRWRAALAGAGTSTVLVHLAGKVFPWYVQVFASDDPLRVIYGSVGIIPVFLLWLYCLWIFVLLGVEVAFVTQNFHGLLEAEREQWERSRAVVRSLDVSAALEVAVHVAAAFQRGAGPVEVDALAAACGLAPRDLRAVMAVLERDKLVVRVGEGWLLSRPPESIPLARVAGAWRLATSVRKGGEDPVGDAVGEALGEALQGSLADGVRRWLGAAAG